MFPRTSEKALLALNKGKQGKWSKQTQILLTGTPMKVARAQPKGSSKPFRGPLQPLQNSSKTRLRGVLEVGNFEKLFFLRCTMRNHNCWQCQTARRQPKSSKLVSKLLSGWLENVLYCPLTEGNNQNKVTEKTAGMSMPHETLEIVFNCTSETRENVL